jgi:hypothetical protein
MTYDPGEGPSDKAKSREHADRVLKDPKHHAEKGSPRDLRTVDDDIEDPTKRKDDK